MNSKRVAVIDGDSETLQLLSELGATVETGAQFAARDFDALVVLGEVTDTVLREFYDGDRPIASVGVFVSILARALGRHGITVAAKKDLSDTGAIVEECADNDFISDREHRIVTTPTHAGLRKALKELVEMA